MGDNERPVIAAEQTTLVQCLKGGDRAVVLQITEPSRLLIVTEPAWVCYRWTLLLCFEFISSQKPSGL